MQFKLKKISSDASFREFFRLYKGRKTSIIVRAKKERFKNLTVYSVINKFLRDKGIHTPKLISQYFKEGKIDMDKEMVLFCAGGLRSALATKTLQNMGFKNICHVDGGFGSMQSSGFKVIK